MMGAALVLAALPISPAHGQSQPEADVLAHSIARGQIFQRSDFTRQPVAAAQARFALSADRAVGMEARRMLPAGTALRASDLAPPTLVHRGDAITLSLRTGRLIITAPGKALADGGAGASIRVVSLPTGRTLDGRVRAPSEVEIAAP